MTKVQCFRLPSECEGLNIGPNVVVIDVLRASTTICHALWNNAKAVKPFAEIDKAVDYSRRTKGPVLTGGERGGEKVKGFDLGNSPLDYTTSTVGGKTIAFTTTNGTRAMEKCRGASKVVIGAFCNLNVVEEYFRQENQLDLVCAGTDGEISIEDCAFAGALVEKMQADKNVELNDGAKYCLDCWLTAKPNVPEYLQSGLGGKNLLRLNRHEDIAFASRLNSIPVVPRLDIESWTIDPA